ncbi:VOC family protein [Allonocardiopsis opalescens]|uniref:Putative enzyme related to lactoylglutathione lyase n=1 Tax=Allonocardiopsis opalescens TaxID=1144618 RepID=A0A2T0Q7H5_9ACTN|nr:VOC family protein [Allonocardiopsis opalescens]PRX99741.1 putative enzyme related to lactoylglutathione lyase [Allonocardiopsis opalescens]
MAGEPRFRFTKIVVDDLDAQAAFYSAVLGQVVGHRFGGGEGDGVFEEVVMGPARGDDGPSLLLVRYPRRRTPRPGEAVLGFAVADVDETVRAAEAAGGVVRAEPRFLPQVAMRVARVEDPEGHLLEIVQQV